VERMKTTTKKVEEALSEIDDYTFEIRNQLDSGINLDLAQMVYDLAAQAKLVSEAWEELRSEWDDNDKYEQLHSVGMI